MAVGADDLALLYLGQDGFPGTFAHALADAELLLFEVIELEDERVVFSAIDTRMLAKEGNEIDSALGDDPLRAAAGRIDVALLVAGLVLVLIGGPARSAVVVALTARLPAPGKFVQRLLLLAAPADFHLRQLKDTNRRFHQATAESGGRELNPHHRLGRARLYR
jgi:hypothetical protein